MRHDYSGAFDADLTLADFGRQCLADLGREYLLNGHLQDRVSLPLVAKRFGGDAYVEFSIIEWMGASPIYSKRMQRALGFEGEDVTTVFKNLQLEIGSPQQFMDFQFRLDSPDYGEFWLAHCGALLDVEPFGEKRVKLMCHDIEDPTFDATAAATHPCMKMRPIHRPPRQPAGRYPHCRWSVYIDHDDPTPYEQHSNLALMRGSKLASIGIVEPQGEGEPGGFADYSGAFDPGFQLEDLSHHALVVALQEFTVQSHLLVRSLLLCASQRLPAEETAELARAQWTGIAALTADRVRRALAIEGDGVEAIAKVFQLHPCFHPRSYIDLRVELLDEMHVRIALGNCPALQEGDECSWFAGLSDAPHTAFEAIATAINPRARCATTEVRPNEAFAWNIVLDLDAEPAEPPPELALAHISRGATFQFERRRTLRP